MNMEGGKLFCLTEGKGNHEGPGYCNRYFFSFEVVAVLMLVHCCHSLSGVIFDTNKDEDKFNFIFLLGAGISG